MFVAALDNENVWKPILQHPVILHSLQWIQENGTTQPQGIYDLAENGWYVNIHAYTTKNEEDCNWENHTQTVDIQYIIEGEENIRWCNAKELGSITVFNEATDTQRFALRNNHANLLTLQQGMFVIFIPGEAHCPQIAVNTEQPIKKLVVKIPLKLLL